MPITFNARPPYQDQGQVVDLPDSRRGHWVIGDALALHTGREDDTMTFVTNAGQLVMAFSAGHLARKLGRSVDELLDLNRQHLIAVAIAEDPQFAGRGDVRAVHLSDGRNIISYTVHGLPG